MFLVPLLFIILVVWILFYLFRGASASHTASNYSQTNASSSNKPLNVLKERYAKGEVSEEEYLRIKRNLE